MLFADIVATSAAVAGTSSRSAKSAALADLLARAEPREIAVAVGFLTGEPHQGRIGVGWRTLSAAERVPADGPSLTVADVDAAITALAGLSGPGSAGARQSLLGDLFARATADEGRFLVRLLGGELRQGAAQGLGIDQVADSQA